MDNIANFLYTSDLRRIASLQSIDQKVCDLSNFAEWASDGLMPLIAASMNRFLRLDIDKSKVESTLKDSNALYQQYLALHLENSLKARLLEITRQLQTRDSRVDKTDAAKKRSFADMLDSDADVAESELFSVFDTCFWLGSRGFVDDVSVLQLVELAFELVPVSQAERLFHYLESRVRVFSSSQMNRTRMSLALLRVCNELLRRAGKTKNATFCGRVLEFLAHSFSVSERSGLNLAGLYNKANVTVYSADYRFAKDRITQLYLAIWKLQRYFTSPVETVTSRASGLGETNFRSHFDLILGEFRTMAKRNFRLSSSAEHVLREQNVFFPKYLTSPDLFLLQLKDENFRKQILVQMAVCLHFYCLKASSELSLSSGFADWISNVARPKVLQLLDLCTLQRDLFRKSSMYVVSHETLWSQWKAEKCPSYIKPPIAFAACDNPSKWQTGSIPEATAEKYSSTAGLGGFEMQKWRRLYASKTRLAEMLQKNNSAIAHNYSLDNLAQQWDEDYPQDSDGNLMENFVTEWTNSRKWHSLRVILSKDISIATLKEPDLSIYFKRQVSKHNL